jgi:hypothetical protein
MLFPMMIAPWRSSSYAQRRPARKKQTLRPRVRLFVERLEDRCVPSTTWIEQGPGPILNGGNVEIPGGPEAGAVQALAVDPTNANIVYAGTVNGGVWKTTNATAANPTWTPLTDQQLPALSIDSLAISPVNSNIVYAGTGSWSSFGAMDGSPGVGLARSTDGGATWQVLAADTFTNQRIYKVVPTTLDAGNVVLADARGAGNSVAGFSPGGGVYRSSDGGQTFSRISGAPGSGLPDQFTTDLVADPSNPSRFYAAVGLPFSHVATGSEGVYRSDDCGLTWTPVNTGLTGLNTGPWIRLGSGHGVVYAMVISGAGNLQGVFRSTDLGATWTSMGTPALDIFASKEGSIFGAIAADPTDPNVVFLSGDGIVINNNKTVDIGTVVRGDASLKQPWTSVVDVGANNTAPHPDSRAMVFDNGDLLEASDGGIYRLANPETPATRVWNSASGNLATAEFHSVAYDPVSHVLIGGLQDNGYVVQAAPGNPTWSEFMSGDGGVVAVDSDQAAHPGTSIRYSSIQFFGNTQGLHPKDNPQDIEYLGSFSRQTFDANNVGGTAVPIALRIVAGAGSGKDLFHFDPNIQFFQPFVLNSIDARRMLIGTGNLYESFDQGDSLTDLGSAGAIVGSSTVGNLGYNIAMAYGGRSNGVANPDVFYVGAGAHILHRAHLGDPITTLSAYPGGNVMNLAVDPQDYRRLYVVDQQNRIWASFDEGTSWTELTANLHQLTNDYVGRTITIFSSPSAKDDVLIVGAQGGVFEMVRPEQAGGRWMVLGDGLPHALVLDVHYDYTDNMLVTGTLGRGAWTLADPFGNSGAATTSSLTAAGLSLGTSAASVATLPAGLALAVEPVFLPSPAPSTSAPGQSAGSNTTSATQNAPSISPAHSGGLTSPTFWARPATSSSQELASLLADAEGGWLGDDWLE